MKSDLKNNSFDLEERTAKFGENVIELCLKINKNTLINPIINQLIRSSTSIGANYMEADGACSRKDFRNKIYICKKESQETKHWLRMLNKCLPTEEIKIKKLWREAQELSMIFGKIASSVDKKKI